MKELFTSGRPKLKIRDMTFEVHDRDPRYLMISTEHGAFPNTSGIGRVFDVTEIALIRDYFNKALPLEHTREQPKASPTPKPPARSKGRKAGGVPDRRVSRPQGS